MAKEHETKYHVEARDGDFVIVDDNGAATGDPYTTRRAAIRDLAQYNKSDKIINKDRRRPSDEDEE